MGVWRPGFDPFLSRQHQTPLPLPSLQASVPVSASSSWRLVHFLVPGCACSDGVAGYLARRGPVTAEGTLEEVLLLDDAPVLSARLRGAGWKVSTVHPGSPEGYGVRGGPWLMIFDPNGGTRYSGGYEGKPISGDRDSFEDLAVLARLRRGERVVPFGPFGCIVGSKFLEAGR